MLAVSSPCLSFSSMCELLSFKTFEPFQGDRYHSQSISLPLPLACPLLCPQLPPACSWQEQQPCMGSMGSSRGAGRGKDHRGSSSNRLADVCFSLHLSAQVLQSPSCCCGGSACSVPLQLPAPVKAWQCVGGSRSCSAKSSRGKT